MTKEGTISKKLKTFKKGVTQSAFSKVICQSDTDESFQGEGKIENETESNFSIRAQHTH